MHIARYLDFKTLIDHKTYCTVPTSDQSVSQKKKKKCTSSTSDQVIRNYCIS